MIIESGHFALIMALSVAVFQICVPLWGRQRNQTSLMAMAKPAAGLQFLLVLWSFIALTIAFISSDFSVYLVAENSHAAKPFLYKFAGVWGNHEGSMLLWILILAGFGAFAAYRLPDMPLTMRASLLASQAGLSVLFLSFSLFTSNPFARLAPAPFSGGGLNPILQDPALALHPPLLYLGYVGFSIAFSFTLAVLLEKKPPQNWAAWLRPYVLVAWVFLTLGIALGSFWAYYELGWGGFWFWDPVENASLLPWLAGTALLHSVMVAQMRVSMRKWTLLLSILTFGLSIAGTFLVRSGVLTSVHAFANDPARGVFILAILASAVGLGLVIYALRAERALQNQVDVTPSPDQNFALTSRETALMVNNIFLASAAATVLIGTIYPLIIDALGMGKISVGAPYFNKVFTPLMAPLFILMPVAPFLAWQKGRGLAALKPLRAAAALTLLSGLVLFFTQTETGWSLLGLAAAVWLVTGALADLGKKARLAQGAFRERLQRLLRLPAQQWGVVLAHAGVGVLLFGIVASTAWQEERIVSLQEGQSVQLGDYDLRLEAVSKINGPNYAAEQARLSFDVADEAQTLLPERRFYPVERSQTTEAAILKMWRGNIYVALGDRVPAEADSQSAAPAYVIRAWLHPFVNFIWLGAVLMALGGMVAVMGNALRRGSVLRSAGEGE